MHKITVNALLELTRIIQSLYYALLYYPAIVPIEGAVLFERIYNATEAVPITSRYYLQEYITLQKRYKN
jgi:hypothetical protein